MKTSKYILLQILMLIALISCAQEQDDIVGVWSVDNSYNKAIYEIVEVDHKFYGKIHKYSDGKEEYIGNNKKEDYFLTDVEYKDGKYINGKMYMPDGTYYEVIITVKDSNTLEVAMTVENYPYTETWARKL